MPGRPVEIMALSAMRLREIPTQKQEYPDLHQRKFDRPFSSMQPLLVDKPIG
jgi:hypothetical protein